MLVCDNCRKPIDNSADANSHCPHCGHHLSSTDTHSSTAPSAPDKVDSVADEDLTQIGRYHLTELIAEGSFAAVYRGRDEELGRNVAIKVLHRQYTQSPKVMGSFLKEARILASLEHPGIVPIYDLGHTSSDLYFLVTKFIAGSDLKTRLKEVRFARERTVEIVAQVAEALHHAHRHGLVHRDVKPGNILLDAEERPLLADFGLALRQEEFGTGPMNVGTPLYMSPEQARKEGHRVDARSDIYSLSVVFYEMLTGAHPFHGNGLNELLEFICTGEATPLRDVDRSIPRELERIWFKANAKRASDRYATAREFADDLYHWLSEHSDTSSDLPSRLRVTPVVVPRGLRSFEPEDAPFFLDLLPGPRNRDGLPDSIHFWKTRLESTDPQQAFRVGVLYGPSGCGKSSLVKAGLLPRLADHCVTLFLEASAQHTEARLLQALRQRCPELPAELDLVESFVSLREGKGRGRAQKVLVVVDQFEQWLNASRGSTNPELIDALRQCDGDHVQCLLLVRDDFWLTLSRFMHDLEVPLIEGQNTGLIDLFDPFHAMKVLGAFGRAFGRLPPNMSEWGADERSFLDEAVAGLSENGKIIPVRLTLFAEVVKGKAWTPATLRSLGGTEGIGIVFLEETFSASTAPAAHRLHQEAAATVLQALLPASKTDLKGRIRSREELQTVSGYLHNAQAFDELLRILDQELRLITPTAPDDPEPSTSAAEEVNATQLVAGAVTGGNVAATTSYQLTHDYLVPALRHWLMRKQRSSWRGRAEIRLAERTEEWSVRREKRQLPSWWEWANIRIFTRRGNWNEVQRKMMDSASHYHWLSTFAVVTVLAVSGYLGSRFRDQLVDERRGAQADRLVAEIKDFHASNLARFREQVVANSHWTRPRLQAFVSDPQTMPEDRLHARLVLLTLDPDQVVPLRDELLKAEPHELFEIRAALLPYKERVIDALWQDFADQDLTPEKRFRAACALAEFDPDNPRWPQAAPEIVSQLLAENTFFLSQWLEALRPIRQALLPALGTIFRDRDHPPRQIGVADAVASYAADQPEVLVDLLLAANPQQYARLWPTVQEQRDLVQPILEREALQPKTNAAESVARRRAQAVITLFRLGNEEPLRKLLDSHPDREVRTYLVYLFARLEANPAAVIRRYQHMTEATPRRLLLLALGEFDKDRVSARDRLPLIRSLWATYRDDPDPGLHSAVGWLLRRWGEEEELRKVDAELSSSGPRGQRRWYVDSQSQTFAVVAGPVKFDQGSPVSDAERFEDERLHRVRIPRSFAIGTAEVTLEQFLRFEPQYVYSKRQNPEAKAAMCGLSWYDAVRYCRWLSEQAGLPEEEMCYPSLDQIKEGMKLPDNLLSRTGYRLPTESEWEYACRGGTTTSRFYGDSFELLGDYGWHTGNSQGRNHAVGMLRPNDLGLFDVFGNVWEWCQDAYAPYPEGAIEDVGGQPLAGGGNRVLRGGCYSSSDMHLRSAARRGEPPTIRYHHFAGLRLARTLR